MFEAPSGHHSIAKDSIDRLGSYIISRTRRISYQHAFSLGLGFRLSSIRSIEGENGGEEGVKVKSQEQWNTWMDGWKKLGPLLFWYTPPRFGQPLERVRAIIRSTIATM